MTIYDWITAHPDDHLRVILYEPAPDIDDGPYGSPACRDEGTSTIMFDSTTGEGDLTPDLLLKEIINSWDIAFDEDENGIVYNLEYMPDEYYF